jgi:uncharacterized cupin superfamily protein
MVVDVHFPSVLAAPPLAADMAAGWLGRQYLTRCGRLDSAQLPSTLPTKTGLPQPTSVKDHVVKPIMNLDEVEFDDVEENGVYTSSRGQISDHIGAKKLGYNLTILPPGKVQCPFHCHHGEEEMFLILEGEGELRFGDQRYPIRKHDVIACPPGGPEVAHQIVNTGATTMRYLALSTLVDVETCEYPDSQKILVVTGGRGERGLRKMFRAENTVDYYDREKT